MAALKGIQRALQSADPAGPISMVGPLARLPCASPTPQPGRLRGVSTSVCKADKGESNAGNRKAGVRVPKRARIRPGAVVAGLRLLPFLFLPARTRHGERLEE